MNLSLMYLLAPTAATAAGKSMGFIERLFSDQILRSWGAPTGHMFQRGYPFASRVVNLGYKVRSLMQYPIVEMLLEALEWSASMYRAAHTIQHNKMRVCTQPACLRLLYTTADRFGSVAACIFGFLQS